jgi:hypothetical protein
MAAPTKEEMLNDPDFWDLDADRQRALIRQYDPQFDKAAPATVDTFLTNQRNTFMKQQNLRATAGAKLDDQQAQVQAQQPQSWFNRNVAQPVTNLVSKVAPASPFQNPLKYDPTYGSEAVAKAVVPQEAWELPLYAAGPLGKAVGKAVPALKAAPALSRMLGTAAAGAAMEGGQQALGGGANPDESTGAAALKGALKSGGTQTIGEAIPALTGMMRRNGPGAQAAIENEMAGSVARPVTKRLSQAGSQDVAEAVGKTNTEHLADLVKQGAPGSQYRAQRAKELEGIVGKTGSQKFEKAWDGVRELINGSLEPSGKGWSLNIPALQDSFNAKADTLRQALPPQLYNELQNAIFRGGSRGGKDVAGNLGGWLKKFGMGALAAGGSAMGLGHATGMFGPAMEIAAGLAGGGWATRELPRAASYAGRKPLELTAEQASKVASRAPALVNALRKTLPEASATTIDDAAKRLRMWLGANQ